jgi:hypothetical protein
MNYLTQCTRRILTVALSVAIALSLSGCESVPVSPASGKEKSSPVSGSSVQDLLTQAVAAPPARAASLYLAAAWAQFQQGDLKAAEKTRELVNQQILNPADRNSYQLLSAELAIARGDSEAAERWLAAMQFAADPDPARSCAARGNFICAANQLILSAGDDPTDNNLIWRYMGLAPGLLVAAQTQSPQSVQRGWWQLKQATLQSLSIAETRKAVDFWRQAWPQHPASRQLPSALRALIDGNWHPRHLGVVLPLSGPLARAGQAVRDGFVVTYLHGGDQDGVLMTFYDSESTPLPQLYETLLADGVDLVIGPLRKERVAQFNALDPEIPVLALNYLDLDPGLTPDVSAELFQLGLAIEDEAATMISELEALEVESLLVFHNYEDWSLRARRQLSDNWQGRITVQSFTDIRTITEAVGTAMEVDQSLAREQALTDLLGEEIEFLPRARQDIDAVVALVDNVEANALVPALQFHFADGLPVYASSQVVRGARREQLQELNGFQVSELPFYLGKDPLFEVMQEPFALQGNRFSSLHALGIDAFRISMMLGALERNNTSIMIGSTGVLSLADDGSFHRQLGWSVISNGQVRNRARVSTQPSIGD